MAVGESSRIRAILRAQWKSFLAQRHAGGRAGRAIAALMWVVWYGLWALVGASAGVFAASASPGMLSIALPWLLLGVAAFWQLAPILTANLGAAIHLKKLLIYPVSERDLFGVEVMLRATAALEVLLVLAGIALGLLRNSAVPRWAPVPALLLYTCFNLLLAVGTRSLLERLLAMKRIREVVVLFIVFCVAIPQFMAAMGMPAGLRTFLLTRSQPVFPWAAAAQLAAGARVLTSALSLLAWTALALAFSQWQFRRSLRFDAAAAHASGASSRAGLARRTGLIIPLVSSLFRDPLAAIIEKDLRALVRAPRFRVIFIMGFTFGAVVWWPMLYQGGARSAAVYPVVVSGYALVLLADLVFWNHFGFDRAGAQLYFTMPVPFRDVLRAKNLAAGIFVAIEVTVVMLVCLIIRVPLGPGIILETYWVAFVLAIYSMSAGNLSSVYHPRPMDPEHSWGRASAGRSQVYLLLVFPLFLIPIGLAYLAAYAFASRTAFFLVLAFDTLAGAVLYRIATPSAVAAAERGREQFLGALGQSSGPIVTE